MIAVGILEVVGPREGETVGLLVVGEPVGSEVLMIGEELGLFDGDVVGRLVGENVMARRGSMIPQFSTPWTRSG